MIHVAQLLQSRRRLVLRLKQVFLLLLRALLGDGDTRTRPASAAAEWRLADAGRASSAKWSVGMFVDDIGGETADAAAASVADASRQGRHDRRPRVLHVLHLLQLHQIVHRGAGILLLIVHRAMIWPECQARRPQAIKASPWSIAEPDRCCPIKRPYN